MEFSYSYAGSSVARSSAAATEMSLKPDTRRQPTFFRGALKKKLAFREAISALHDVVVSDLRWKPKDREAYKAWLATQEEADWAEIAGMRAEVTEQIAALQGDLHRLRDRRRQRWNKFYRARQRYFDYIFERDYDAWLVLDPVITVHPDEIFFECFSKDESSYGRLATGYEVYETLGERACGTTNVDYSRGLYDEFQKIRSYKSTALEIDPSGFEVETSYEAAHKEVKIELPDSWVRGFLQVSSAMTLPATTIELHPMDVYNLCLFLRRHREIVGPRGMRFVLEPDRPLEVIFEPWNTRVRCARSIYAGDKAREIRVWGRRRIHILERLIPLAERFTVHLLGTGMPSFWVADLGDMSFTLGLSGWTANDWSRAGNFDLMAPRAEVDDLTRRRVFEALAECWQAPASDLATRLELDRAVVLGALAGYAQAGRAIFDLARGVYRVRELSREPLPLDSLRYANPREAEAIKLIDAGRVGVRASEADGKLRLEGSIEERGRRLLPVLVLDADERLVHATCTCNFFQMNRMMRGPCHHMLAIRAAHGRQLRGETLPIAVLIDRSPEEAAASPRVTRVPSAADHAADDDEQKRGLLRGLIDRLRGSGAVPGHWARVAEIGVPRALRQLAAAGEIEIARGQDEVVRTAAVAAGGRARDIDSAVRRAYGVLVATRRVTVKGGEQAIKDVLRDCLEAATAKLEEDA